MTILTYHAIDPGWRSPLSVSPPRFAQQSAWLSRSGPPVVPLSTEVGWSSRQIALTFDDGFASIYDAITKELLPRGLPSTVFVISDSVEIREGGAPWVEGPELLRPTLSAAQVVDLSELGVSIGSHTRTHADLVCLDDGELLDELRNSRLALEDLVHCRITDVAYPRGRFDDRVIRAASLAGFTSGYGMAQRHVPTERTFAVPRYGVYEHDRSFGLRVKASSWYPALRSDPRIASMRAPRSVTG